MAKSPRPIPYQADLDSSFADGVRKFPWEPWIRGEVQIGWYAAGPCPRCGHTMAHYRRRALGVQPGQSSKVTCNCTQPHPGRPAGVDQGCGQFAYVVFDTSPPVSGKRAPR